jgi:uncharacterized membrane protein YdbT with pleckstrin-like domain
MKNDTLITEKVYPVSTLWVIKLPLIFVLVNVVALLFGLYFPYLVLAIPVLLVTNPLNKKSFHYALEDKFLVVDQGFLSKKHRTLPYGVIQNVLLKQDLFDRMFGLANVRIENAAQAGGAVNKPKMKSFQLFNGKKKNQNELGSFGNQVNIFGLRKSDAEKLKLAILEKVKDNPLEDTNSGL